MSRTERPLTVAPPPGGASRGRQRRPSGAAPPLPRKIGVSGKVWLVLAVVVAMHLAWLGFEQPVPAARFETRVLAGLAELRTPWLSDLMGGINTVGTYWGHIVLAWGLVLALVAFRRWRHLFVFLGAYAVLLLIGTALYDKVARSRPTESG